MGSNFLVELLQNVTNDQALTAGLEKLSVANKDAYRQAVNDLEKFSSNQAAVSESRTIEESRLASLLRHIS